MSMDIEHRKTGDGDAAREGRWVWRSSFEKSAHFVVELFGKRAFMSTRQTGLYCTPLFHNAC